MSERGCVVVWTLCTVFMAKVLLAVLWNYLLALLVVSGKQVIKCEHFQTPARPTKPRDQCRPEATTKFCAHCSLNDCLRTAPRQ